MSRPDLTHERRLGGRVAGIDEAGRGPLAGPVVAAAVMFTSPPDGALIGLIDDSKKLSAARRLRAFDALGESGAAIGIGAASVGEIDRLNILQATFLAMRRALARLGVVPDAVLIDGNRVPLDLPCHGHAIIGGDGISLSIAAASIVAKVTRDRIMARLDARLAGYGWAKNAGYGTAQHLQALGVLGASRHHRLSFAPLAGHGINVS